ncbi:MAG: TIGR04563 family protein [Pseudomonadota bacterium]
MPRKKKAGVVAAAAGAAGAMRGGALTSQGERQSIYFPKDMAEEIKAEALRQDRSISWIIQKAWRISRQKMKQLPGANELEAEYSPPKKK